jgi:uncharacterized RDD family membrane protein YckC
MQPDILDTTLTSDKPLIYAPLWRRVLAALIDTAVLCVIGIFIAIANRDLPRPITLAIMPIFGLLYFVYLIKQSGATGGKMAMRLKIVRKDGKALSWQDAALRYIMVFLISSYAVAPFMLAELFPSADINPSKWIIIQGRTSNSFIHIPFVLMALWSIITPVLLLLNKNRRTLHDFLAGTVVIHQS